MLVIAVVLVWIVGMCSLLGLVYRKALADAWAEPILRAPVLILESDDWGYGPLAQAEALTGIADVLACFRDARGAHPVMTLGIVLGGPDSVRICADNCRVYHRLTLADPELASVRTAMLNGLQRGVFALQLHGMEHFWPACVMRAAMTDERIGHWLTAGGFPCTEALPSPLQSRWIDASVLPSKPLTINEVTAAATEEVATFAAVFGSVPTVAVPPTFLWTRDVEKVWAARGVRGVVTPGYRSEQRDHEGKIVLGDRAIVNAQTTADGITYVVRDCYFEPSLGHTHERTIEDLRAKTHLGRPTLVEIHRSNFIGDTPTVQKCMDEVRLLLETTAPTFPSIRYMSTADLVRHYRETSALVDRRMGARVHFLIRRIASISRLRKLAWATGAALPAWLTYVVTRSWGSHNAESLS